MKTNKENKIEEIFSELKDEFKWGGGEDNEGALSAGEPDFDKAQKEIETHISQTIKQAKEEGRQETFDEINHENIKLVDGFSHPKDCAMCLKLTNK